jgi:hypothetical protein
MIEDQAFLPFIASYHTYILPRQEPWVLGCAADGAGAATTGIDPAPLLAAALQDRRRGMCVCTY